MWNWDQKGRAVLRIYANKPMCPGTFSVIQTSRRFVCSSTWRRDSVTSWQHDTIIRVASHIARSHVTAISDTISRHGDGATIWATTALLLFPPIGLTLLSLPQAKCLGALKINIPFGQSFLSSGHHVIILQSLQVIIPLFLALRLSDKHTTF